MSLPTSDFQQGDPNDSLHDKKEAHREKQEEPGVQEKKEAKSSEIGNSTDRFSRFGQRAQVISSKGNKQMLAVMVGAAALVFILILMCSGGHHHLKKGQAVVSSASENDLLLEQNANRLSALENAAKTPSEKSVNMPSFPAVLNVHHREDKAFVARRNAPTQMYSAKGEVGGVTMQNASASHHRDNAVLAGSGSFSTYANDQASDFSTVSAVRIRHPYETIAQGELIHATLETAINSDLPGMVRAVVADPVYAFMGQAALIPAGSRLVGQYASMSSNGSATERVFVIWNRLITPQGVSIMINSPGSDQLGRAGLAADVINTHFFRIFGTAMLLSVMSASTASVDVSPYDQPNSANQYREAVASSLQSSAASSLNQNLSIKPTLHIHQGASINVFVAHDLDLHAVMGSSA